MPNASVPAVSGGLPSRRAALATLMGAGAALTIPGAAIAASTADADLIALATGVETMSKRSMELWCIRSTHEDRAEALRPAAPVKPERRSADCQRGSGDCQITEYHEGDVSIILKKWKPPASEVADTERHEAAMRDWEAECEKIERRVGVHAAARRCERLDRRLEAAAGTLTEMRPTTMRGVVAKARAADAVNPRQAFADPWMQQLSASVVLDLVAIGGAA